jgi:hypothetical protein
VSLFSPALWLGELFSSKQSKPFMKFMQAAEISSSTATAVQQQQYSSGQWVQTRLSLSAQVYFSCSSTAPAGCCA